uniref:Uncharacterized protein n=1 Tax=Rhizophagus irregularis (strain DAOM 181602 / DAOM 197198 / MUCL 43194) TaxID=747089 RepID=U9SN67_RHIID
MSKDRWRCGEHFKTARSLRHTTSKKSTPIVSHRYDYTIRKYNFVLGARNPELKQTVEQTRQKDARKRRHSTVERPYYKEYSRLRFDVIRSPPGRGNQHSL